MKKQKNDSRLEERVNNLEAVVRQLMDGVNKQAHLWYATKSAYNFILSNFPKENTQDQAKTEEKKEDEKA